MSLNKLLMLIGLTLFIVHTITTNNVRTKKQAKAEPDPIEIALEKLKSNPVIINGQYSDKDKEIYYGCKNEPMYETYDDLVLTWCGQIVYGMKDYTKKYGAEKTLEFIKEISWAID